MLKPHRAFIADRFSGDDKMWAWSAVVFLQIRGVSSTTIHERLSVVHTVHAESGLPCEELFGDPEEWAEEQLTTLTPTDATTLRQPTRESWAGRGWYVAVTTLIWAGFLMNFMTPFNPADPLPGNAVLVTAAGALLLGLWGIVLVGYQLSKFWSDPHVFWQCFVPVALALASVPVTFAIFAPQAELWSYGPPKGALLVVFATAAAAVWVLWGARRRTWPPGPLTDQQWRNRFRTIMVLHLCHTPAATTGYLRELTADAHELGTSLNDLGTPEQLAAQCGPTEPPAYPWHGFGMELLGTALYGGIAAYFWVTAEHTLAYFISAFGIVHLVIAIRKVRRSLTERTNITSAATPQNPTAAGVRDPWFNLAEYFLEQRHVRSDAISDAIAAAKTELHHVHLDQPNKTPEDVFGEPEDWARKQCDQWNQTGGRHVPVLTWQHPIGWWYNLSRASVYIPLAVAVVVLMTGAWATPATPQFSGLLAVGIAVFPLGCALPQWLLPRLPRRYVVAASGVFAVGLVTLCVATWFWLRHASTPDHVTAWLPPQGLIVLLLPLFGWWARSGLRSRIEPPYDRLRPLSDAAWRRLAQATAVHFCGVTSGQARRAVRSAVADAGSGKVFVVHGHPVTWATTTFPAAKTTSVGLPLMGLWLSLALAAIAWEQQLSDWALLFPSILISVALYLALDELGSRK